MQVNPSERLSIKEILSHDLFRRLLNISDLEETYDEDFDEVSGKKRSLILKIF